ncbi:MAG: isocitrate lyase [Sphingomonadaceae bacterium]
MASRDQHIAALQADWEQHPRWHGIVRHHTAAEVLHLRGACQADHALAQRGAAKLWEALHAEPFVPALGALTAEQALQQVAAGLKAIYLSPQPGADSATLVPPLVRSIHQQLQHADLQQRSQGRALTDDVAPIVAEGAAGVAALIEAGVAAVHFDDLLCDGVLLPTSAAIARLCAARLQADAMGVPTLLIARTDAVAAAWLAADSDADDQPFCTGERSLDGYCRVRPGIAPALARALAFAPYVDLLWCDTGKPDLALAKRFAEAIHARHPGKLLAYHCALSYHWKQNFDDATIARFQRELGAMGYRLQFVAPAGVPDVGHGMFQLAHEYARRQLSAIVELKVA